MKQIMFQGKFPVRLQEFSKENLSLSTLDELCQYFRDKIEKHPFARYIDTFDHYAHTRGLNDGIVGESIIGAMNIIFCFGRKLDNPQVLSVRPRSIGVCSTESQFIISFLEAPNPVLTEKIEQWVCDLETNQNA